jgi:outer membrane immunogenic protein
MRKIVLTFLALVLASLATGAYAADMAVKARPAPPPPPVFSWTGFYVGLHGGGDWFSKDWFEPATPINVGCAGCPGPAGNHTASSWLAGGQIGFNYQAGMWLVGVEADGSWTDLKATSPLVPLPIVLQINSKTDAFGTIAGRVGVTANQALFFVKGGGAWAHDRFFTSGTPGGPFPGPQGVPLQSADDTRWGWMVGAGIEYAFTNNWSVKAEYNYLDFGTRTETLQPVPANCPGCGAFQYDVRQHIDVVKVGFNYRFGWTGPVVAKY